MNKTLDDACAEAIAEIRAMAGRQFDPKIVDVFLRVMAVGRT